MEEARRNPRIPEDTVFYAIYPDLPPDSPPAEAAAALRSLHLHLIQSVLAPHLRDYIWQHEPFHLSIPSSSSAASATAASNCPFCGSPSLPHLHGKTRFGDNLDDEWFIVFLLFEASRAVPSLSARVWDSDGEFLLIEAAFSLPRWLDPDTSTNRVFIRRGDVHIVPRDRFPSGPPLAAALDAVRNEDVDTRASDAVQAAISRRISSYPERARANTHRVRVRVPLPVAQVLKHEPCLVSLAVEGFYDRDVDSMKDAARMDKFLRSNGGGIEMVRVSVPMSRAMYAQLVQQNFQAPRCYPMPSREEGPAAYIEAELGMKIACGFEMMYQERRRAGKEGKGTTWEAFKRSLESSGCFEGLLPGSKEYQRIMDSALEYYKSSSLSSRTREIMNAPVLRIDEILSMPCSVDDFKGIELPLDDDDSWLYNGEDELNSAILERQKEMENYKAERKHRKDKRQKDTADGSSSLSDDFNLGDIVETMQAFVQKVSSFEGAEVPPNRNSKAVELDADQFMKIMGSVAGEASREETARDAVIEGDTSSSDMDFDDSEDEGDIAEDGNGDTFMQSYSDALNKELNATTLKRSFIRASQQHSNNCNEGPSNAPKEMDEELTPVDVDANLVKSFLDSFSSQQGLAGPASNVLGLMGVKVPPDAKKM
ncbi:protein ecdysoneless homolog [Phoenix dactylifera]|uniref:Protein ecdysoneless homolog n=1 Tax=Phoenix dactylifera TaxID=42345 RepID=A0A8B7CIY6_PHODC|nr:protein ecdysoneless homolog [Phoenix dactylifera]